MTEKEFDELIRKTIEEVRSEGVARRLREEKINDNIRSVKEVLAIQKRIWIASQPGRSDAKYNSEKQHNKFNNQKNISEGMNP